MTVAESKECFGKYWEERNPECMGGPDPMYTHPITGSKQRDRCDFYEQCGRTFRANNAQQRLQNLIPTNNLIKNQGVQIPVQHNQPQTRVPQPAYQPPPRPAYQAALQQYAPPPPPTAFPTQYYPAVYHPTQLLQPYETPSFLSVLEPDDPKVSIWRRVFTESVRAACKGTLQHGTFLIDHLPLYRVKK
jgi:hypothetical protein